MLGCKGKYRQQSLKLEIIVRKVGKEKVVSEKLIKEVEVKIAKTILDLGFRHKEQLEIIGNIQEENIPLQARMLSNKYEKCKFCFFRQFYIVKPIKIM